MQFEYSSGFGMRNRLAFLCLLASLCVVALHACSEAPAPGAEGPASGSASATPETSAGTEQPAMDHAAMDHGHMLTPEQFAELRRKIPLYAVLTDEQIMENMGRMPPDWWSVLSPPGIQGQVGVLALGHGYKLGGNEQFKEKLAPIASEYPTAAAPGMAMMSSSHIQQAVDALSSQFGVDTIVVIPMEPGDDGSLIHQWQYIFGLREQAPYLSAPRIKTDAKIIFTKSPQASPLVSTILRDHALEVADDPATARVILVSHGPERVEENPAELAVLEAHARRIRESSEFRDIQVLSLQDDAVPEVRAANKARLREMIAEATAAGREAIIVPMILTRGGFHARLKGDLEGLTYKFADRGLIEHPLFQQWIADTIRNAIEQSG